MDVRFACNGCGKCCRDHHVPLTLQEAWDWTSDGGQLIVLAEAFLDDGQGLPEGQGEHARGRSLPVRCGDATAHVAITFAAFNPGPCRNLDADDRCRIYARRPLVCRIYPMEINPHIPLRPEAKECPPETWQEGPALLRGGRLVDAELAELVERSRQADRDEIGAKAAICERLGIHTAALKGDGFAAYLPAMAALQETMLAVCGPDGDGVPASQAWLLHVARADLAGRLQAAGAAVAPVAQEGCTFIALQQAA